MAATKAQLDALKKARAARKRKSKGLSGFAMPKTTDIMDGFKKAGLIVAGFVGSREISRKIFKDDAEGFKRYLGSVLQVGGGVLLCTQKNEPLRYIGYGMTAAGAVDAASKVLNKDILSEGLLSGLSLGDIFSGKSLPAYDASKIKLPADYLPDLPPIEGNEDIREQVHEYNHEDVSGSSNETREML